MTRWDKNPHSIEQIVSGHVVIDKLDALAQVASTSDEVMIFWRIPWVSSIRNIGRKDDDCSNFPCVRTKIDETEMLPSDA